MHDESQGHGHDQDPNQHDPAAQPTIAELTAQGVIDRADITRLQEQGTADREHIAELQRQADVDREILASLAEQGLADRAQITQLQTALITARRIGAAMGILMATTNTDEPGAFEALRTASQNSNRKLRDVADDLLYTGTLVSVSQRRAAGATGST